MYQDFFGHGPFMPTNLEKSPHGCVLKLIGFIVMFVVYCFMVLCSCSSSSKIQTHVSSFDTLTTVSTSATVSHAVDSASSVQHNVEYHRDSLVTDITFTEAETINEQITESIDSLGRVTSRVTNRTTQRNTSRKDNSLSVAADFSASEQLAVYLSYLDSIANAYYACHEVHNADSLSVVKEPAPQHPLPWYLRLAYFVSEVFGYAVLVFFVVGIGSLVCKYIKGK